MDIFYIRHKLGCVSPILPDEQLQYSQTKLRAITLSSAISRGLWTPFMCMGGVMLRITDWRVILSGRLFPFYTQETDLWFHGRGAEVSCDVIQTVSLAKGHYGQCVEIYSRNPHRRQTWITSPDLITRIYSNDGTEIEHIILQTMAESSAAQRMDKRVRLPRPVFSITRSERNGE